MNLRELSYDDLCEIGKELELEIPNNKQKLVDMITDCLYYKKYERIKQLGEKGKEGTTYLVKSPNGHTYAMKTFRKTKSEDRLIKEARLQNIASLYNISPRIVDINPSEKYIVMEKMDKHLLDDMKEQHGNLTENQQKQLVEIFKKLDEAKVFHGDSNILNYMLYKNKIYMIDFGMSKPIDNKLIKKLGTNTPNFTLMNLGLILKLKELDCPPTSYEYLIKFVTEDDKKKYGLI